MAQMAQEQGRTPQGVYVLILSHALTGHITHFLRIGRFLLGRGWPVGLLGPTSHRARIEAAGIEFFQLRGLADLDEDRLFCRGDASSEYARLPAHERAFLDTKTQVLDTVPDQWDSIKETLVALHARGGGGGGGGGVRKVVVICDPFVYGYLPLKHGAALPDGVAEPRSLCVSVCPPLIRGAGKVPFGFPFPYDPSPAGAALAEVLWQRWAAMSAPLAAMLDGKILEAGAARGMGSEVLFAGHNYAVHEAILHLGLPSLEYPRDDWPTGFQFVGVFPPDDKVGGPEGDDDETAHVPWWGDFVANASLPRDDPARKRVVLVTQGTVQTDLTELVVPTMRAAAELQGQEREFVLVAILCRKGAALPDGTEVPANARVVDYLRYGAVLPYVDVWVHNAGYGAVMQAIAAGIPVVAAGEGQDKAENGRRIAWSGIGVDLATERPSPEQVRKGVLDVLTEARYRDRVLEMQKEAAKFPVADIVDKEVRNLARD
ncbi:hypothetical protein RB595_009429 [Gaeumannomyces hyphopodioides]